MSTLIVVSHPDDEVLGAGATSGLLSDQGEDVATCILCGNVDVRRLRPSLDQLQLDLVNAHKIIGATPVAVGNFGNIRLNTVPHIDLVQFIEAAIVEVGATRITTHHPHDLNDDHLHTSRACQAAARLFQRREDVPPLQELLFMEVLSSTEWRPAGVSPAFDPDTFFEIQQEFLEIKLSTLGAYRGVMREYPHPRSKEAVVVHPKSDFRSS